MSWKTSSGSRRDSRCRWTGSRSGMYADLIAWYTARRNVLATYQAAFTKEGQQLPPGVADAIAAADASVKEMRPLGTKLISDQPCRRRRSTGSIASIAASACLRTADRGRSLKIASVPRSGSSTTSRSRSARLQAARILSSSAAPFAPDKTRKLKESGRHAGATYLDSVLVADQWARDAATKIDDIKVLGTTLRTQKALHGSPTPWNDLLRKTTSARVAKLVWVAEKLNKVLAAWQLVDASIAVLAGGKTASDRASAGIIWRRRRPAREARCSALLGSSLFTPTSTSGRW